MISVVTALALLLGMTTSYSFAESKGEEPGTITASEEKLVEKIVEQDADILYDGDKKIEKIPEKDDAVKIEGLSKDEQKSIEEINLYKIEDVNVSSGDEECATVVADIQLAETEATASSSDSEEMTKKCGRVTAYMKWWFTKKTFKGMPCIKLTKTGGKITKKENAGLVIRGLKSTYKGYGTYFTSGGKKYVSGNYTKSKNHSTSSPGTLKTWDTSSINRYYHTGGTGILQTKFTVTYGGSSASQQSTYSVSANLASM